MKNNGAVPLIGIFHRKNRGHPKVGRLSVGAFAAIQNRRNSLYAYGLSRIGIGTEWTSRGHVSGPLAHCERNRFGHFLALGDNFRCLQRVHRRHGENACAAFPPAPNLLEENGEADFKVASE